MADTREDQYLDLQGFIHEIAVAPTGTAEDPWPFWLMVNSGHGEVTAQIHREDAEQIVAFFTRHLAQGS